MPLEEAIYPNFNTLYILTKISNFGHDKSQAILQYRRLASPPTLFFFGDGVSGKLPQLSSDANKY